MRFLLLLFLFAAAVTAQYSANSTTKECEAAPVNPFTTVGVPWSIEEEDVYLARAVNEVNIRVTRWNERVVQFAHKRHASVAEHTAEKAALTAEGEQLQEDSYQLTLRSIRLELRKDNSY